MEPDLELREVTCPACEGRGKVPLDPITVLQREIYLRRTAGETYKTIATSLGKRSQWVRTEYAKAVGRLRRAKHDSRPTT